MNELKNIVLNMSPYLSSKLVVKDFMTWFS